MTTTAKETFLEPHVRDALVAEGNSVLAAILETLKKKPTHDQWPILRCTKRTCLVCGGPRGGKSDIATDYLCARRDYDKPERFWLGGATYEMTKPEFDYLADKFQKMNLLHYSKPG